MRTLYADDKEEPKSGGDDNYNQSYEDAPITESDFNEGYNRDDEFDNSSDDDDDE